MGFKSMFLELLASGCLSNRNSSISEQNPTHKIVKHCHIVSIFQYGFYATMQLHTEFGGTKSFERSGKGFSFFLFLWNSMEKISLLPDTYHTCLSDMQP